MFIFHINSTMRLISVVTTLLVVVCCAPLSSDPVKTVVLNRDTENTNNADTTKSTKSNIFTFAIDDNTDNIIKDYGSKDRDYKNNYFVTEAAQFRSSRWSPLPGGHIARELLEERKLIKNDKLHIISLVLFEQLLSYSDELATFDKDDFYHKATMEKRKINRRDTRKRMNSYDYEKSLYLKYGTCHSFQHFSSKPFYMVDSCPIYADLSLVELCQFENTRNNIKWWQDSSIDMSNIPVQSQDGVVYKNVYCSACHGVVNISTWAASLNCDEISPLEIYDGKKTITLLSSVGKSATCSLQLYPSDVSHIIFCTEADFKFHGTPHNRVRQTGYDINEGASQSPFPLSFQILMNFGINGKGHIFFSTGPSEPVEVMECYDDEVYDPYLDACRKITCRDGYELVDYKCEPITHSFTTDDTTDEELERLKDTGELSQITMNINPNCEVLINLFKDSVKDDIKHGLGEFLNISLSRIQNITLDITNNTDSDTFIEVKTISNIIENRKSIINDNINFVQLNSTEAITETYEATAYDSKSSSQDVNSRYSTHPGSYHDRGPEADSVMSPFPFEPKTTPDYRDYCEKTITVKIMFTLLPKTKKTWKEKTNDMLINDIKNMLVIHKSFTIDLNGKDLEVTDFTNDEVINPVILDTWCLGGTRHYYKGNEFDVIERYDNKLNSTVRGIYVNSTDSFYNPGLFDLYIWVDGQFGLFTNVTTLTYVFVCKLPKIIDKGCARLDVNEKEYTVIKENNTVLFHDKIYSMSEYEYVNFSIGEIRLCIPDTYFDKDKLASSASCGTSFVNVTLAEGYLSFVLGVISLVAMATVLITYAIFEKLRNLPGVNTINLTTALFLAELVFISSGYVKPHFKWLCGTVGVLLHFLFLATFFWTSVMSYDVFRTFANKCILTRIRNKRKYAPRYALYAWGSPACIVILCTIIDFTHVIPNIRIGYGGLVAHKSDNSLHMTTPKPNIFLMENFTNPIKSHQLYGPPKQNFGCWIQEPVASLVAFGLPMILILVANSIMFIRTIICIRAVTKLAHFKTRRSSINHITGKQDVMLYVRMSTVMGFTWIFGLASSIVSAFTETPSEVNCIVLHSLGILFVVMNSSQGLFIFFAFIFNKRVLSLYRHLFTTFRQTLSKVPSSASSSTSISTIK